MGFNINTHQSSLRMEHGAASKAAPRNTRKESNGRRRRFIGWDPRKEEQYVTRERGKKSALNPTTWELFAKSRKSSIFPCCHCTRRTRKVLTVIFFYLCWMGGNFSNNVCSGSEIWRPLMWSWISRLHGLTCKSKPAARLPTFNPFGSQLW